MAKSPDAFRTISEVSEWLDTPAHVLRFWESKFTQVRPVKRAGGRRYYRPQDMLLLGGIKELLHEQGMTIKGVQKLLREQGIPHVTALAPPLGDEDADNVVPLRPAPDDPVPPSTPTPDDAATPDQNSDPDDPKMQFSLFPEENIIPDDPADTDSFAPARLLGDLARAPEGLLRKRAAKLAPLVARLEKIHAAS